MHPIFNDRYLFASHISILYGMKGGNRGSKPYKVRVTPPPDVLEQFKDINRPMKYWEPKPPHDTPREFPDPTPEQDFVVQLMGEKIKMGSLVSPDDYVEPVTLIKILPQLVIRREIFGYTTVCYGKHLKDKTFVKKPVLGEFQLNDGNYGSKAALRLQPPQQFVPGHILDSRVFLQYNCSCVRVTGRTKGKGFQGVMARHGFKGGPQSHGSRHHRGRGAMGGGTDPGRVFPGTRMAGREGNKRCTFRRVKILGVNPVDNYLLVRGQVPGNRKGELILTINNESDKYCLKKKHPPLTKFYM